MFRIMMAKLKQKMFRLLTKSLQEYKHVDSK
jgi:hypothetical protein